MKGWETLLAERESDDHFVVEGQLAVERLLQSGYEVIKTIRIGEEVSREEASKLLGYHFHRGYLAIARKPAQPELGDFGEGPLVVLPEIADPGNLGTIIRNAAALGASGVLLGKGASPFNAKAIRASAGNLFRLLVRRSPNLLADLKIIAQSRTIIGTDLGKGSIPFSELAPLSQDVALILGPEDFGISEEIRSLCDYLTYLPMTRGVDSLNVASSSAIFLHELSR